MSEEVVALGAWCDLVPPEKFTGSPGGASFRIGEFALLADGRRLTLHLERGFTSWSFTLADGRRQLAEPWTRISRQSLELEVLGVVSPEDDSDEDGHPWRWLRSLLLAHGIEASVEHLQSVPFTVEFSERLELRLRDAASWRTEAPE